jgi:ubiquinone/menaquinone biosynthesis C-methylase UbiE
MTTNYDPIAESYKRSKEQPWRTHIEAFTLLELIGGPAGLTVLDVACGEGFYTRLLRQRGAARVTGVDLSQGMIDLARRQEAQQQLGITYLLGDACKLAFAAEYDLVVAAYLLNYAHNREELRAMCAGIARSLKPGGRFVTVNSNPALHYPMAPSYRPYGFETQAARPYVEGAPITWTFFLPDRSFSIENYYLDMAVHEESLRAAGFREVRWYPPRVSSEGESLYGAEFWKDFLEIPPVTFLECLR